MNFINWMETRRDGKTRQEGAKCKKIAINLCVYGEQECDEQYRLDAIAITRLEDETEERRSYIVARDGGV